MSDIEFFSKHISELHAALRTLDALLALNVHVTFLQEFLDKNVGSVRGI